MHTTITTAILPSLRAVALVLVLLAAACASPEPGSQPDPLSGLHFMPAAVAPLDAPVQTGRGPTSLVLSRNAERLMEGGETPGAAEGQAIVRGAMALLRRHDRRLQLAHNLDEARDQQAASTLVLDVRDSVPDTGARTVLVTLVALDQEQMPVSRIEARGTAETGGFRAAGVEALRGFERQIDVMLR